MLSLHAILQQQACAELYTELEEGCTDRQLRSKVVAVEGSLLHVVGLAARTNETLSRVSGNLHSPPFQTSDGAPQSVFHVLIQLTGD